MLVTGGIHSGLLTAFRNGSAILSALELRVEGVVVTSSFRKTSRAASKSSVATETHLDSLRASPFLFQIIVKFWEIHCFIFLVVYFCSKVEVRFSVRFLLRLRHRAGQSRNADAIGKDEATVRKTITETPPEVSIKQILLLHLLLYRPLTQILPNHVEQSTSSTATTPYNAPTTTTTTSTQQSTRTSGGETSGQTLAVKPLMSIETHSVRNGGGTATRMPPLRQETRKRSTNVERARERQGKRLLPVRPGLSRQVPRT